MSERRYPERKIPFFPNHDGMSCGQCVYKMILAHFYPEHERSNEDMDIFCGAIKGKATWPYRALVNCATEGLSVVTWHGDFDVSRFVEDPYGYMREQFTEDVYNYAIEKSDVEQAVIDARDYNDLKKAGDVTCYPSANLGDLRHYLDDGYLINLWVNSGALNHSEFSGHFILVYDYDDKGVYAHYAAGYDKKTQKLNDYPDRYITDEVLMAAVQKDDAGKISDMVAIRKK